MNRQFRSTRKTVCSVISMILATAALAGCAAVEPAAGARASVQLEPTRGNTAAGRIEFVQQGDRVLVRGTLSGLQPENAEHGFHVHEKGDCSSGDGMSAGGHFNPLGKPHAHGTSERHAGDLPAIRAAADGTASYLVEVDVITVRAGPTSVLGKALIVHRDPDDYSTQPTGNSGSRVACGVIHAD
ncbi:MAG TPA: superoxide dismutase family protein [Accumulibacter sp.]|uniref:superoxide dismutase family protein n=2 Tax=Accumulibacter sp. TaxID=2053492 RepID=UPI0025CF8455|nr:superoxide dismutase family protein [Accumulibacter sp.]MCM8599105.1 superoxide dismutase family protein [Accumulibacter sp.]HNC52148.1 superoxide dismutase family protein [Accumulibacter sp.]